MKIYLSLWLLLLFGCQSLKQPMDTIAQSIVDEAIAAHGGELYDDLNLEFDFRKYHFKVIRKNGEYTYTRSYVDSTGTITDVLGNNGITRTLNGENVALDEKMQGRISGSVNSQVYFVLLPYGLNDAAVIKEYLGEKSVKGEPYHKVKVTFMEDGGGEDFEDVYIYWFHKEKKTMDYLAYEFHVNKGGFRFREAVNVRNAEGLIFADYINYKESDASTPLADYDDLLEKGKLVELSRVEIKNIKVVSE